jgi:hypothetical protein
MEQVIKNIKQDKEEPNEERGVSAESYLPSDNERKFILNTYKKYLDCYNLKNQPQELLNGRTLTDFWKQNRYDYNVLTEESGIDDPVVPYVSSISRDKSNTFISNLASQLVYPSVTAQNQNQDIDHIMCSVSKSLLEWAYNNDGRPDESGHQKMVRYIHTQVIDGTTHIQDDIIENRLFSSLVPNEEIFIPNFYQPSIQKQPRLFRVQNNALYEEAEELFGSLPNWKYVQKGRINDWASDEEFFSKEYSGLIDTDKVQIIRYWENIPKHLFKNFGIKNGVKKAKLFNILINGVLMFKITNLSPYKDGLYPISKGIFEQFSDANYYWGNSMPNKAREDKKWLDGWKTLIRHKAKLSAIPPLVTFNGTFLDSDVFIPGEVTQAPNGMKPEDIMALPEVSKGVSNGDIAIYQDAKSEINEGNLSPQAAGGESARQQTAREAIIREQNEQRILGAFGLQVAFLVESRTYPILKRLFQFLSKKQISKISVPDQSLGDGKYGNLEIIFEDIPEMSEEEYQQKSIDLFVEQKESEKEGKPMKRIYVNPKYLNELDLYITVVADPQPKKTSALRRSEAMEKFGIYGARPDLFNARAAAKKLVYEMGDDINEMVNKQEAQPQGQPSAQGNQQTPKVENPSTNSYKSQVADLANLNM